MNIGSHSAYPLMRVEEMYFIEVEAKAHSSVREGLTLLENFMSQYRRPNYALWVNKDDVAKESAIKMIVEQKRIELWGEGQSFFDYKRLDMGVDRTNQDDQEYIPHSQQLCCALSLLMTHLSRFSEEIIMWCSWEFKFVELDDAFATGSSIMPQKKNPDIAELVRGKTGRVYGALMALLTTMKGLPLAYNKDMQEDKEMAFDAMDTAADCITLFTGMIQTMKFRKDRMAKSAMNGFTNATDAADYLVGKGVPFRDAHGIIGRLVLYCIEKDTSIDALSLEELRSISDKFDEDIYDAISLKTCVEKRLTIGAPGEKMMKQVIQKNKEYLKNDAIEEYQQSLEDRLS